MALVKFTDLTAFSATGADRTADVLAIVNISDNTSYKITPAEFQVNYIPRLLGTSAALDTTLRQVSDGAGTPNNSQLYLATNKSAFAGSLSVGQTAAPSSTIDVIGSGTTNATITGWFKNSASAALLKVYDGLKIEMLNALFTFDQNGAFKLDSGGSARFVGLFSNTYSAGGAAQGYIAFTDYNSAQEIVRIGDDGSARNLIVSDNSNFTGLGSNVILGCNSTSKAFRLPRMTTTDKNNIASPGAGMMVFDTTLAKACVHSGSGWETITSA